MLAADAAAHCRAGLVSIMADSAVYTAFAGQVRSVMAKPWDPSGDPKAFDLSPYTGLVIGPGWGVTERRQRWLSAMADSELPAAVDADGLSLLRRVADEEGRASGFLGGRWVLTPHPGEFAALADVSRSQILADPLSCCRSVAERFGAVVVLKGHVTWIVTPDGRHSVVDGMNPAMATGGAGDVLAGLIGAFLGAGLPAYQAARAGVLLHAEAGARTYRRLGWFVSQDLPAEVAKLLRDVDDRRHG
jgi:NAD(P)H-hydrate epimerase